MNRIDAFGQSKLVYGRVPWAIAHNKISKGDAQQFGAMVSDPNIFPSPHMVTGFSLRPVTSSISHFPPKHRVRFRVSESLSFPIRTPSRLSSKQMSTESAADSNAIVSSDGKAANPDILVQYVVLQRDLIEKWPLGSIVTQGCHASVCAIWAYKDDPHTIEYCSPENIDSMHKVFVRDFLFFSCLDCRICLASCEKFDLFVEFVTWFFENFVDLNTKFKKY